VKSERTKDNLLFVTVDSKQMTYNNKQHIDVYKLVNDRITELLEKGVIPWQQPWTDAGHPKNLISGINYRGINVWLLSSLRYQRNLFLTFKQATELGAIIKKGEKAHPVVFWKWLENENKETKKTERIPILRYYSIFNIEQCSGIPLEKVPPITQKENNPIETCEQIITEMPQRPKIYHIEQRAFYDRVSDSINVPKLETFKSSEDYYATLFHELVHSTGHVERLGRRELTESRGMRSKEYATEELTAEMGASYLKSHAGILIEQLENNASYIKHWLEQLKDDKRLFIHASAQAQRATDYILNIKEKEMEIKVEINDQKIEADLIGERKEALRKIKSFER